MRTEQGKPGNRRAAAMSILFVAVPSTLAALTSLYFALTDRTMAALAFGIALGFPSIALWLHALNHHRAQRERRQANAPHPLPPKRCPGPVKEAQPNERETEPDEALLISMAVCLQHGFGTLGPAQQQSMLHDMRKLWDEIHGCGYYTPENRDRYLALLNDTDPLAALAPANEAEPVTAPSPNELADARRWRVARRLLAAFDIDFTIALLSDRMASEEEAAATEARIDALIDEASKGDAAC